MYKNWKKIDPNVNRSYLWIVSLQVTFMFSSLFYRLIVNKMTTNHVYNLNNKNYDKTDQSMDSLVLWNSYI